MGGEPLYVRVTEMLEGYTSDGQGGFVERRSTGAIRVGPIHTSRRCPFLNGSGRHTVFEIDWGMLQDHPMFGLLGTCQHCYRKEGPNERF